MNIQKLCAIWLLTSGCCMPSFYVSAMDMSDRRAATIARKIEQGGIGAKVLQDIQMDGLDPFVPYHVDYYLLESDYRYKKMCENRELSRENGCLYNDEKQKWALPSWHPYIRFDVLDVHGMMCDKEITTFTRTYELIDVAIKTCNPGVIKALANHYGVQKIKTWLSGRTHEYFSDMLSVAGAPLVLTDNKLHTIKLLIEIDGDSVRHKPIDPDLHAYDEIPQILNDQNIQKTPAQIRLLKEIDAQLRGHPVYRGFIITPTKIAFIAGFAAVCLAALGKIIHSWCTKAEDIDEEDKQTDTKEVME